MSEENKYWIKKAKKLEEELKDLKQYIKGFKDAVFYLGGGK